MKCIVNWIPPVIQNAYDIKLPGDVTNIEKTEEKRQIIVLQNEAVQQQMKTICQSIKISKNSSPNTSVGDLTKDVTGDDTRND